MTLLRIATRQSPLALWQAEHVADLLTANHPGLRVELVKMVTEGDRILDRALSAEGGKGLFIKELEQGIADGRADLAVHSMKDVPAELPPGFDLPVFCAAADPRDALVSGVAGSLDALPPGARIGTASLRRGCQLLARRPDLRLVLTRGNVQTRLAKLDRGDCDALLLAAAGLDRLGLADRIAARLPIDVMLPAVTQGVLGLECRAGDTVVMALLEPLHEPDTALRVRAERAFAARLGGGCHTPLAAHAVLDGPQLHLTGLVGSPDGRRVLRQSASGPAQAPEALGLALAEQLIAQGAAELLAGHG
ncbi:MAG: hydroxymethylbilane synthase [Pseudomonadota bacterium]